jgi:putative peptidoglycan lipid II flippase
MMGFLVLANFLISFFFGYGKFSLVDVELTAEATRYYALSLAFMFIWPILYRAYQVLNWLKPVFFIAILGILANALFNYLFVVVYNLGIKGVCLGTFFAYVLLCLLSYTMLYFKKKPNGD